MEFAICFKGFVKPDRAKALVRLAESAGFTYCWFYDSHILWRESFAQMAKRFKIVIFSPKITIFGLGFCNLLFKHFQEAFSSSII